MFLILPTPPTTTPSKQAPTEHHQLLVRSPLPSRFLDLGPAASYEELRTQLKSEIGILYGAPTNEEIVQLLEQSGRWAYCEKCHSQFKISATCSSTSHTRPLDTIPEDRPDSRIDAWVDSVCNFMAEMRFKCVICGEDDRSFPVVRRGAW